MVLAVWLDTFAAGKETSVFNIGTDERSCLTKVRPDMLANCSSSPLARSGCRRSSRQVWRG